MSNAIKDLRDLVFQKGGIGKSLSRHETTERLNPLLKEAHVLHQSYRAVIRNLDPAEGELAATLALHAKTLRGDIAKLNETVYSMGGVAYLGTDLEPDQFDLGDTDDGRLFELRDREAGFLQLVEGERRLEGYDHQLRTRAIIMNVITHAQGRLNVLKQATVKRRRS